MTLRYCRYLTSFKRAKLREAWVFDLEMNTRPGRPAGRYFLPRALVRAGATLAAGCSKQAPVGIVRPANSA